MVTDDSDEFKDVSDDDAAVFLPSSLGSLASAASSGGVGDDEALRFFCRCSRGDDIATTDMVVVPGKSVPLLVTIFVALR